MPLFSKRKGGSRRSTQRQSRDHIIPVNKIIATLKRKFNKNLEPLAFYPVDGGLKEVSRLIRHYFRELNYLVEEHESLVLQSDGQYDFKNERNRGFPGLKRWVWIYAPVQLNNLTGPEYAALAMTWIEAQLAKRINLDAHLTSDYVDHEIFTHQEQNSRFFLSDCKEGEVFANSPCRGCRETPDTVEEDPDTRCSDEVRFAINNLFSTEDRKRLFGRPIVLEMLRVASILFNAQAIYTDMRDVKCKNRDKTLEELLQETCEGMVNDFNGVGLLPGELHRSDDPLYLQDRCTIPVGPEQLL